MGMMFARRRAEAHKIQKAQATEERHAELKASSQEPEGNKDDGAKLEGTEQSSPTSGVRGKDPPSRKRDLQQDSE